MDIRNYKEYDELLSTNFPIIRDREVYLDIDFPILFSFTSLNKTFLAYVLKYKRRKKELVIVVSETTNYEILDLITQRLSIHEIIAKNFHSVWKTEQQAFKIETKQLLQFDIVEKLPDPEFMLEESLPNKIDLIFKQNLIKDKIDFEITNLKNFKNNNYISTYKKERLIPDDFFQDFLSENVVCFLNSVKEMPQISVDEKLFQDYGEYTEKILK